MEKYVNWPTPLINSIKKSIEKILASIAASSQFFRGKFSAGIYNMFLCLKYKDIYTYFM